MSDVQMTRTHYPVVIVGAGMVGAALACALADEGIESLVLEAGVLNTAADWPEDEVDPRVSALSLASQNLLAHLGAWDSIESMARFQDYQDMYVWDACGTGHIEFKASEQHLPNLGHILENKTITTALHQQLQQRGVEVWSQVQLKDMSPQTDSPRRLYFADGREITADLVVGADGANSKVRQLSGLPTREWDYPHHALVTRVATELPHDNTCWQRFTENGILAFLPLRSPTDSDAGSHCSIVWSQPALPAERLRDLPAEQFCAELERAFEGRLGKILTTDERYVIPLRQRHAKRYVQAGLVLVGDAAHTIHPLAGQGVNLGFLDVAALVQTLAEAQANGLYLGALKVLEKHQQRRRTDNLRMMALMESFARLFGNQHPLLSAIRNSAMHMMQSLGPIKQHLAQEALGVGAHLPPLNQPVKAVEKLCQGQ
jgi:2-octaprenylphenol hydroxylase